MAAAKQNSTEQKDSLSTEDRLSTGSTIIDKYAKWSFGAGLIPAPVLDLIALTGIQMKMLSEIAEVYGQKYSDDSVRSTLGALIGGTLPQSLTTAGAGSFLKSIPVLGTVAGMLTMPVISAASTYAIGNTFIKHFESGGTFLSVDINAMKSDAEELAAKYRSDKKSEESSAPAAG